MERAAKVLLDTNFSEAKRIRASEVRNAKKNNNNNKQKTEGIKLRQQQKIKQ